jgi:uncharacterized protein (DUF4415 family)
MNGCTTGFLNNILELSSTESDIYKMPKAQEAKNKGGRPKLNKTTISIRLSNDVLAQVREAAASGGNLSAFIEQAIREKVGGKRAQRQNAKK